MDGGLIFSVPTHENRNFYGQEIKNSSKARKSAHMFF